jgi:membrane protein YdbS with pleckstrin-like domain
MADASDRVLLSIRPVFIGWIVVLQQLPLQLFFTVWTGGFFGGMSSAFFHSRVRGELSFVPFVLFGAVAFLGVPLVAVLGKKLNYSRTEYRFFPDRLEFEEGFFTLNRKVVKYRDMKEVSLRRGILQRGCGLGTIYLATLATGTGGRMTNPFYALGFGNISASGIGVRDIRDPEAIFERVRKLVDAEAPQ